MHECRNLLRAVHGFTLVHGTKVFHQPIVQILPILAGQIDWKRDLSHWKASTFFRKNGERLRSLHAPPFDHEGLAVIWPVIDGHDVVERALLLASPVSSNRAGGKTYLLTTKNGGELVFKPELDSRIGLNTLALGSGSYIDKQKTAHLNLATQDTAKAFGCEDVVVKYSVGSHDGQFGIFMEKAKGYPSNAFKERKLQGNDGIAPAEMRKIVNASVRTKIQGAIAQKLNKLMWLDLITGQGDRHWGNYFVHVDKDTKEVTIKGIDNDASFSSWRVGLQKYSFDKEKAAEFEETLKNVCSKIHGWGGED